MYQKSSTGEWKEFGDNARKLKWVDQIATTIREESLVKNPDSGVGIPPEALGEVFKPFTQADSTLHRDFDGTGLGLALSHRLADAMGGTITVESVPGRGSTFTFRFPIQSVPSAPTTPPRQEGAMASRPDGMGLVLVVEDDCDSRALAGKMLQSLGYRAEFAADGAEAVRTFAPGKFSAILMDIIAMPVMDGLDATKKPGRARRPPESGFQS